MIRCVVTACVALCAAAAQAQSVVPCDWQASADAIPEPWETHTRSFANGKVRLAMLDVIEPALGWAYLLVLSPPYDELGARQCRVVGHGAVGFAGMAFDQLDASYSPETGLFFTLPVQAFDGEAAQKVELWVQLNQATGQIEAGLR